MTETGARNEPRGGPQRGAGFWDRLDFETGEKSLPGYLAAGIQRHGLSFLAALIVAYGGVALLMFFVLGGAVVGAFLGVLGALAATVAPAVAEALGLGGWVELVAPEGIGSVGLGLVGGAVAGAVAGLAYWAGGVVREAGGGPMLFVIGWLGNVLPGLVAAVVLLLALLVGERAYLHLRGCRRMSERERGRVLPLLEDVCATLETRGRPTVLIHDRAEVVQAYAEMRHIVLYRTVVDGLDDEELAGLIAHEVNHWRRGDAVAGTFVVACALPVILAYNAAVWSGQNLPNLLSAVVWIFAWPAVISVRFVLVPILGLYRRRHEYEADRAAVEAGYGEGMYRVVERMRDLEPGRNGFERAVAATHPPAELRLEAIERAMEELEEARCPSCGADVSRGGRFCGSCGAEIGGVRA